MRAVLAGLAAYALLIGCGPGGSADNTSPDAASSLSTLIAIKLSTPIAVVQLTPGEATVLAAASTVVHTATRQSNAQSVRYPATSAAVRSSYLTLSTAPISPD